MFSLGAAVGQITTIAGLFGNLKNIEGYNEGFIEIFRRTCVSMYIYTVFLDLVVDTART